MSDDLLKRARHNAEADMPHHASASLIAEMADRIEELHNEWRMNADGWSNALIRIAELEAKLAKAVDALEGVKVFVRDLEPYADQGHTLVPALEKACTTLAELKGEK